MLGMLNLNQYVISDDTYHLASGRSDKQCNVCKVQLYEGHMFNVHSPKGFIKLLCHIAIRP